MKAMTKVLALLLVCVLLCGTLAACGEKKTEEPKNTVTDAYADKDYGFQLELPAAEDTVAVMHTSMGDIYIRLFPEAAPKAVENFTTHAKNGYYNGLTFHRVIENFMIQGGDPKGDGTGGDSIWKKDFEDEFDKKLVNIRGALAMANGGPATNGSQFFINQIGPTGDTAAKMKEAVEASNKEVREQGAAVYQQYVQYYGASFTSMYPTAQSFINANMAPVADLVPDAVWELYAKQGGNIQLDGAWRYTGGHTVFGQVFAGMDVVDAIAKVETDDNDKPKTAVTITSIDVVTYSTIAGTITDEK